MLALPANLDLFYYVEFLGKPLEQVAPGASLKMGEPAGLTLYGGHGGAITCAPGAHGFLLGEVVTLNSKLKGELVAPQPLYPHALLVAFTDFDLCEYAATNFKTKLTLEPFTISLSKQKLKLTNAVDSHCPKKMSFSTVYKPKVTGGGKPPLRPSRLAGGRRVSAQGDTVVRSSLTAETDVAFEIPQARTSRTMLNGVSAARRTCVKPPSLRTSVSRRSPACAPSARPTS